MFNKLFSVQSFLIASIFSTLIFLPYFSYAAESTPVAATEIPLLKSMGGVCDSTVLNPFLTDSPCVQGQLASEFSQVFNDFYIPQYDSNNQPLFNWYNLRDVRGWFDANLSGMAQVLVNEDRSPMGFIDSSITTKMNSTYKKDVILLLLQAKLISFGLNAYGDMQQGLVIDQYVLDFLNYPDINAMTTYLASFPNSRSQTALTTFTNSMTPNLSARNLFSSIVTFIHVINSEIKADGVDDIDYFVGQSINNASGLPVENSIQENISSLKVSFLESAFMQPPPMDGSLPLLPPEPVATTLGENSGPVIGNTSAMITQLIDMVMLFEPLFIMYQDKLLPIILQNDPAHMCPDNCPTQ